MVRSRRPAVPAPVRPRGTTTIVEPALRRPRAVAYMAERYRWDPKRVEGAILRLADHMGETAEVFYPDPQNYKEVVVIRIRRIRQNVYEISEEKRSARLALDPGVRYTSVVPASKAVSVSSLSQEAHTMPARTRRAPAKAKAKEPEPVVVEDEELEDEEELDDELEDDEEVEDEESEDDEEEEDEEEDEEEQDEEPEDEEEPEAEEVKDYTPYAGKAPTPTMADFGQWLLDEVYPEGLPEGWDEDAFLDGVRLGGTLRMEFQRSEFCRLRREERKAENAAASRATAVKAAKAKPAESEATAPAKSKATKPAPAKAPVTKAPAAKPAPAKAPAAKPTTRKPGAAVVGRPAPRAADRPAKAAAPARGARRGKAATTEEPF